MGSNKSLTDPKAVLKMSGTQREPTRRGILIGLTVSSMLFAAIVCELGLRTIGFRFDTFPTVQFGWPEPVEIAEVYTPDRDLFWVTHDYHTKLAAARHTRPAVAFMGDSCTEFGTWPKLTLEQLARSDPSLAQGVNLAVGGWSSEQGLRQMRRDVLSLGPRVVTIYYGWNDHWIAFGRPDAAVHPSAVSFWLAGHSRLMELFIKWRVASATSSPEDASYRVPLDRYRANLETMARLAHDAGIRVIFITAASSHERGQEPEYLARRHLLRLEELVPLHASYVQATRAAAAATGAEVCDAAAEFMTLPAPRSQYFGRDGIHFNDRGSRALADILTGCLDPGRPASKR